MKNLRNCTSSRLIIFFCISVCFFSSLSYASSTVDPNATVVSLRKSCQTNADYLDNCFESTAALTAWLWNGGRANPPSSSDRVHVEMGPGDFSEFECNGDLNSPKGWVSVNGTGRENSRFVRTTPGLGFGGACKGGIEIFHCDSLSFSNLGAHGPTGVEWWGAGTGNWNQVDIVGETTASNSCGVQEPYTVGWYDIPGGSTEGSVQYFFSSRIWAVGENAPAALVAFDSFLAESWFYASDVAALPTSQSSEIITAVFLLEPADARFFGGTIRTLASGNSLGQTTNLFGGVWMKGGNFHMHGGIISIDASGFESGYIDQTYGILAENAYGAKTVVHTPDTAFVILPGGASNFVDRIKTKGDTSPITILSPFTWQPSSQPPVAESLHGQDMFVDTDAGEQGGEAHLMIRDHSCAGAGGKWRDAVTGDCRAP